MMWDRDSVYARHRITFYSADALVRAALQSDELVVRPLRAADVDLEYEEVMVSQKALRGSSGGK